MGSTRYRDEWRKQWFSLPYTPNPERDRYFAVYFSNEWKTQYSTSLENYLNSLFLALPPPKVIALASVKDTISSMRAEIEALKRKPALPLIAALLPDSTSYPPVLSRETSLNEAPVEKSFIPPPPLIDQDDAQQVRRTIIGKRKGEILRARFSPSCSYLAASGKDATCVVWSSGNNNTTATSSTLSKTPRLFCEATSSCLDWYDDGLLGVGTNDHTIYVWNLHSVFAANSSGTSKIGVLRTALTMPWVLDIAFNPASVGGSNLVASCAPAVSTLPGELQLWNVQTEKLDRILPVEPISTRFNYVKFNHNGNLLVAGGSDGMIRVYDASRTGSAIMGWPAFSPGVGCSSLCLSHNETSVFAFDGKRTVVEFSLHRVGEAIRKFTLGEIITPQQQEVFGTPSRSDISASSKNGLALAFNGKAYVWNDVGNGSAQSSSSSPEPILPWRIVNRASAVDWDESKLLCGGTDGIVSTCTF